IEVDLGLGDVQEAPRLAAGALARFRTRQHVIGRGQNLSGAAVGRAQRAEGLDQRQRDLAGSIGAVVLVGSGGAGNMSSHAVDFSARRGLAQSVTPPAAILLAGPTASGKSSLALKLAQGLGGVIINADSMQVYRDLRIITARPTPAEEQAVPHRLYGHIDVAENYSVGRWCVDAAAALEEAERAGRLPILVGGTGLYFKALTHGLAAVPQIPAGVPAAVRARLKAEGIAPLYAELQARDPAG